MKEEKNKKYVSVVLDRGCDEEMINRLELVSRFCGVSMKEILREGLNSENMRIKVSEGLKVVKELIR